MGIDDYGKRFPVGWGVVAKPCESCKTAAALLFCRTDSAYMCMPCDAKLHGARRHERVWMCEVCEQAPASVTCKADAAALCVTCDRDIHSANPLARRHERIPVVPFYETAESVMKSTAATFLQDSAVEEAHPILIGHQNDKTSLCMGHEIDSSWLSPGNNNINTKNPVEIHPDMKSIEFLFSDPDNLSEFDCPVPSDIVVPIQVSKATPSPQVLIDQSEDNHFEIDFTTSNVSSFNNSYAAQSICQTVSSSSMDVGVVPDGSCMSEMSSYPFSLQMNGGVELNHNGSIANGNNQVMGMDREARVMRYREKRKNRKFEKTIRYASRKAYAETRPRIKGRFVKRDETDSDVDCWFTPNNSTGLMGDTRYGVVPSIL